MAEDTEVLLAEYAGGGEGCLGRPREAENVSPPNIESVVNPLPGPCRALGSLTADDEDVEIGC